MKKSILAKVWFSMKFIIYLDQFNMHQSVFIRQQTQVQVSLYYFRLNGMSLMVGGWCLYMGWGCADSSTDLRLYDVIYSSQPALSCLNHLCPQPQGLQQLSTSSVLRSGPTHLSATESQNEHGIYLRALECILLRSRLNKVLFSGFNMCLTLCCSQPHDLNRTCFQYQNRIFELHLGSD